MQPDDVQRTETDHEETGGLSRRQLLKVLAAAGVSAGLAQFLPLDWVKPVAAQAPNFGCLPEPCVITDFPLTINATGSRIVPPPGGNPNPGNGNPVLFLVNFGFNDSAGLLNSSLQLTATVERSNEITTVYNGTMLSAASGYLNTTMQQAYKPACWQEGLTIYTTNGFGSFQVPLQQNPAPTARHEANQFATLNFYVTDTCQRISNEVSTLLEPNPTAVSLSDFVVDDARQQAVSAAGVAGAAVLGAATLKAVLSQDEGEEPSNNSQ